MLGHKSAALTLDVYADLFDDDLEALSDRMDKAVTIARADQVRTTRGLAALAIESRKSQDEAGGNELTRPQARPRGLPRPAAPPTRPAGPAFAARTAPGSPISGISVVVAALQPLITDQAGTFTDVPTAAPPLHALTPNLVS